MLRGPFFDGISVYAGNELGDRCRRAAQMGLAMVEDLEVRRLHIPPGSKVRIGHSVLPHTKQVVGPEADRLAGLGTIHRTLNRCMVGMVRLRALMSGRGPQPTDADEAFEEVVLSGIIVEYARCFDGQSLARLDASAVFLDAHDRKHHDWFMTQRSTHVAHDTSDWRGTIVVVHLDQDGSPVGVGRAVMQGVLSGDRLGQLETLIASALNYVERDASDETKRVFEAVSAMTVTQRLALPDFAASGPSDRNKRRRTGG